MNNSTKNYDSFVNFGQQMKNKKKLTNNFNNYLTFDGYKYLERVFIKMKSLGMIVKSSSILYNMKKDKKEQMFPYSLYKKDEDGEFRLNSDGERMLIKYSSLYGSIRDNHNALHVLTGEKHGGYIGIDIDVKKLSKDGDRQFIKILNDKCGLPLNSTFWGKTPSGGLHFIFKCNSQQKNSLRDFSTRQNILFNDLGLEIDVLYNGSRFIMEGFFKKKDGKMIIYQIMNFIEPGFLPTYLFEELMKNINKPEEQKILPKEKKIDDVKVEPLKDFNPTKEEKRIMEYLECLKPERCSLREDWVKVGIILFNEDCSKELFNEWSKKCEEKYDRKSVDGTWRSFNKNNKNKLTLSTLIKMAKEDNYNDNYKKFLLKNRPKIQDLLKNNEHHIRIYETIMDKIMKDPSDFNVGLLFQTVYPDDYIYDCENMQWYTCNRYGIYSRDTEELLSARTKMSEDLFDLFTNLYNVYFRLYNDETKNRNNENIIQSYTKISKSLTSLSRKKVIIEQLKEFYKVKKFREKMNRNKYLFAFSNGVYDMKTFEFRNAKKEELVFETTSYKYKPSHACERKLIKKTISDMFTTKEMYSYFLTILSLRLVKINELEEFYFMIGKASNGKGLITSLIENTFGKFSQTLNSDTFCQNKHGVHSEAASPAIASTYNSNIVFVNELGNKMKITADILKKMSGNDKIKTRFLRENFFEFIPGYSLFFVSNFEPIIDGSDGGIQRRLRFIPFNVTFSDNPKGSNEKKINRELKQLFKEEKYYCAFFDVLKDYYHTYINNKKVIYVPDEVKFKSNEYLDENDPVKQFVESCLQITDDDDDKIYSSRMMELFRTYNNNQTRGYTPDKLKKRLIDDFNLRCKRTSAGVTYVGVCELEE